MAMYYQNRRMSLRPACGLHEDEPIESQRKPQKAVPSFPLSVFPPAIRNIVEALVEYEHFNVNFIAASVFTTFAAAMGNHWAVRFSATWVERPIMYVALIGYPSCGKTPPLRLALSPLLNLDREYDRVYCAQLKAYKQWESKSQKERVALSLPEEMERPRRRCHVVVDATIEALIGAMRDNPQGVILYSDELESLFANFNRYNSSAESYFLSAFSGTPFKYIRKSTDEHIFLPNPHCSIIGSTQPGRLAKQFGGERVVNGFSSRFLKVYPDIADMPTWGSDRMPDGIMEQWERIIRKVVTFDFKGKEQPTELTFSLEAHRKLCDWKESVNNAIYSATESEAEKAVCGKLETYLMRFCLIIRIMKSICNGESVAMIDAGSAEAAIGLVEYFREMENRVIRVSLSGNLDKRQTELLDALPYDFRTSDAIDLGRSLGMSESTIKRFLKNSALFKKEEHGRYTKMSYDP
ncbi:MAG: DUF3987 domain-containing protein [Muribaculaceae bacterium]